MSVIMMSGRACCWVCWTWLCLLLSVLDLVVLAVECVGLGCACCWVCFSKTARQLLPCELVTCVLNWCRRMVNKWFVLLNWCRRMVNEWFVLLNWCRRMVNEWFVLLNWCRRMVNEWFGWLDGKLHRPSKVFYLTGSTIPQSNSKLFAWPRLTLPVTSDSWPLLAL